MTLMNSTPVPVQIVANNGKLGIVAPNYGVITASEARIGKIELSTGSNLLHSMSGFSFTVHPYCELKIEMIVQDILVDPDQGKLLDFGLVDNMSVRQLFEAINTKLSKR